MALPLETALVAFEAELPDVGSAAFGALVDDDRLLTLNVGGESICALRSKWRAGADAVIATPCGGELHVVGRVVFAWWRGNGAHARSAGDA